VRVGEPGYSIKNLERFYMPARTTAVVSGGESLVIYDRFLTGDERKNGQSAPNADAPQFRELPAPDATLLVAFYDSLHGITETLDSYINQWPTTDVNAWNALMHQVRNSLVLGEKAINVFCADKPFNEASPASGTMLNQYQRATSGAEKALKAHLARHGVS
jgi:hypothetical protein